MPKVCFCVPTYRRPHQKFLDSLEASIPLVQKAGWEECAAWEVGHAYISYARTVLTRRAIRWFGDDADDNCIVYLDDDVSHSSGALLKLLETPGDIVAGTYRFKTEVEDYMGRLAKEEKDPLPESREDGCLPALLAPAGFLKVTRKAIKMIVDFYPDLDFSRDWENGDHHYDLFRHGVLKIRGEKVWFGEDYAFAIRWVHMGQPLWIQPDLDLGHHGVVIAGKKDVQQDFYGNYRKWLDRTGGVVEGEPKPRNTALSGDPSFSVEGKWVDKEEVAA